MTFYVIERNSSDVKRKTIYAITGMKILIKEKYPSNQILSPKTEWGIVVIHI